MGYYCSESNHVRALAVIMLIVKEAMCLDPSTSGNVQVPTPMRMGDDEQR